MPENLEIRVFDGMEPAMIDAEILARILQGVQRAVYIVAMDASGCDPASPNYVPTGVQQAYAVRCLPLQTGSFLIPLVVGDANDMAAEEDVPRVLARVDACLAGLVNGTLDPYLKHIRSARYRVRLLDAFRAMLPKPGASWKLGVTRTGYPEVTLTGDCTRRIMGFKERLRSGETVAQTVTGKLQAMDFRARKITILYPEGNRELECFYDEVIEPDLWETRRGYVQVTGAVVLNADDIPVSIQDVENIQPLDLSDFEIREVALEDRTLRFSPPLILTPELSASKQYMTLCHDDLDIQVMASTREELLQELNEQISVLWREYALENEVALTPRARALKEALIHAASEIPAVA